MTRITGAPDALEANAQWAAMEKRVARALLEQEEESERQRALEQIRGVLAAIISGQHTAQGDREGDGRTERPSTPVRETDDGREQELV
jgi:hypothetical protein